MTGEAGLNALVAQHFRVPVVAISGDQHVGPEAAPFCPGIRRIQVKTSISRYAARHEHPMTARDMIRDGVAEALRRRTAAATGHRLPATIEIEFSPPTWPRRRPGSAAWSRARLGRPLTGDDPLAVPGVHLDRLSHAVAGGDALTGSVDRAKVLGQRQVIMPVPTGRAPRKVACHLLRFKNAVIASRASSRRTGGR